MAPVIVFEALSAQISRPHPYALVAGAYTRAGQLVGRNLMRAGQQ